MSNFTSNSRVFVSGAKSSEEAPRLDLVPLASIIRQAHRMAIGAAGHGEWNYRRGANDADFIRDRKNHLALHVAKYLAGNQDEDHLGAVLANAGMLADLEELACGDKPANLRIPETRTSVPDSRTSNVPDREVSAPTPPDPAPIIPSGKPAHDELYGLAQPCAGGCGKLTHPGPTCRKCRTRPTASRRPSRR